MAWPPPVPPATRANATPQVDTHAADHNQLAGAVANLVGVNWTALTPAAGWVNLAGGYYPLQYAIRGDLVYLRGLLQKTVPTLGAFTITTMPAAARPLHTVVFYCPINGPGLCQVNIDTAGVMATTTAATAGSNFATLACDGLVYSTTVGP